MREDAEHEELTRAGWTPVAGDAGWWRDPSGGERTPAWRALEIARRDARAVADTALREASEALDGVTVAALQVRLELQRKLAAGQDPGARLEALRLATQRLRVLSGELAAMVGRGG